MFIYNSGYIFQKSSDARVSGQILCVLGMRILCANIEGAQCFGQYIDLNSLYRFVYFIYLIWITQLINITFVKAN